MVGRGAPEPKRSWRADKTLLARQAHRSENPPASAVGSVNCELQDGALVILALSVGQRNL